MNYTPAIDVSIYQGTIDFSKVTQPIVLMKVSGGDLGLYYDQDATRNYYGASNAGKAIGMYHFAGNTDPIAEAEFFLRAVSPLAENDVLILDWEVGSADPVGWCTQFVNHVHDKTGVWCLVYLNISTVRAHDWSPVLKNCGLYLAAPSYGFEDNIPNIPFPIVMQQGPTAHVTGIPDNVADTDAWFVTVEQFKGYGYHAPHALPAPTPSPVLTPSPVPDPVPPAPATPVVAPPTPVPPVSTAPNPVTPVVQPPAPGHIIWDEPNGLQKFFSALWGILKSLIGGSDK